MIVCRSCRTEFFASGQRPECCPRCGWRLDAASGERMHVFECRTSGCKGGVRYSEGWLPELALRGCTWSCCDCGTRQVARVPLDESIYRGFVETEEARL